MTTTRLNRIALAISLLLTIVPDATAQQYKKKVTPRDGHKEPCSCKVTKSDGDCKIETNTTTNTKKVVFHFKTEITERNNVNDCSLVINITYLDSSGKALGTKQQMTDLPAGTDLPTESQITIRGTGVMDGAPDGTKRTVLNFSGTCICTNGERKNKPIACPGFACTIDGPD